MKRQPSQQLSGQDVRRPAASRECSAPYRRGRHAIRGFRWSSRCAALAALTILIAGSLEAAGPRNAAAGPTLVGQISGLLGHGETSTTGYTATSAFVSQDGLRFPRPALARSAEGAGTARGVAAWQGAGRAVSPRPLLGQSSVEPLPQRPPGLAFLLSAALPGAGQLYNGNRRGYLFLGVEAVAWFTRLHYTNAGDTRRDDYRNYGDRHWDLQRYRDSQDDEGCVWSESADSTIAAFADERGNDFYEEIGRDDYQCGWDDFEESYAADPSARSPHRSEYLDFRSKENSLRDKASLALGILVLNRVVSAVDAFRTAKSRQTGSSNSLRFESFLEPDEHSQRAVFRLVKEFP